MSNFPSKDETLNKLKSNETLKVLLKNVEDEKHKRVIMGVAEQFLGEFYDMMFAAKNSENTNPEAYNKMVEDLKSRVIIVDSNKPAEKPDVQK